MFHEEMKILEFFMKMVIFVLSKFRPFSWVVVGYL